MAAVMKNFRKESVTSSQACVRLLTLRSFRQPFINREQLAKSAGYAAESARRPRYRMDKTIQILATLRRQAIIAFRLNGIWSMTEAIAAIGDDFRVLHGVLRW